MTEILQWVLIGLSIPLFVAMVIYTVRRARELDRRIEEYHEEQEAAKDQPGAINPYEQMAGLFGADSGSRMADSSEAADSGSRMADGPDARPTTDEPESGTRNAERTTQDGDPE